MQVSWLAVRLRTSRLGAWRSTSAEETRGRRVWGARLHAIPCLAPHLRFRLRACAPPPVMQEHGAAAGTSREGDHTEVWDALIGSVAAAKAAMVQPTGSSEQPAQCGERRVSARPRFAELSGSKLATARAQCHQHLSNGDPDNSHYKTPPCARLAPVRSANSKPRTPPAVGLQVRCPVRAWSTLARPERQRRQRAHVPHGRRELSGRPAPLRRQLRHRPSTWRRLDRRTKPEPSWADRA